MHKSIYALFERRSLPSAEEMYSYHHPKITQRHTNEKGLGLYANENISQGELLLVTGGIIIPTSELKTHPNPEHPFQIERDFLLSPPLGAAKEGIFSTNHSCDPTSGIRGQTSLIALRNINQDEEITYDYVMTDSDPHGVETFKMNCLCGAPNCRKIIRDTDWRIPALQEKYRGYFSSYLAARISQS